MTAERESLLSRFLATREEDTVCQLGEMGLAYRLRKMDGDLPNQRYSCSTHRYVLWVEPGERDNCVVLYVGRAQRRSSSVREVLGDSPDGNGAC